MNASEIITRVNTECDARFGEVIERVLLNLRYHHTHQCWRKECNCEYCQFINRTYVFNKLQLHKLKKRMNWYEYHALNWDHNADLMFLESQMWSQRNHISDLKRHKKDLQKEIL